jgi:hypothetical protein
MAILDENNNVIDPQSVSVRPTGNKWGLIWGLVSVVLSLLFMMTNMIDYSGTKSNMLPNIVSWGASAALIYMGIKTHRDQDLGGFISIGRCVTLGSYMGLIAGVIGAIFTFIYFKFIQPDFMSTIMETAINSAEDRGQDPEQVRKGMEMVGWMFSPGTFSIFALIGSVLAGLIFGLIFGLFMKKEAARPF